MNAEAMMFSLLRAEIRGEDLDERIQRDLTPDVVEAVFTLSKRHDMAHMIGHTLGKKGVLQADETGQRLKKQAMLALYRYTNMNAAYIQICNALEAAQIPYIPLKGSVIRKLYPEPWMRTSCDIDILVKEENLERAARQLEALGYRKREKGIHDISLFSPSGVHLELHFHLIEDCVSKKQTKLLSNVWEDALPVENTSFQYRMSDPMFYFYHVVHMAKHFQSGGCGIRPIMDLWILDHKAAYDRQACERLLAKGELLKFAKAAQKLSEVWFSDAQADGQSRLMARYILDGGVYGTLENKVALQQVQRGSKLRYVAKRIFLPYDAIKYQYPVLQKHKWLLPVFEVYRWGRMIFRGRIRNSAQEVKAAVSVSQEQRMNTADLLEALGLSVR